LFAQAGDDLVGFLDVAGVVDDDRKAVACQALGDGGADAARGAGDDRYFVAGGVCVLVCGCNGVSP